MSVRIMSEVFENSKTQGNARLVLLSLADTCSDEGVCYPSIKTIAKKANISEETTRKFLHVFEKMGLVESEERFSSVGRRTSNTYKLNLSKVGDDELTKDVIYLAIPKSKHRTSDGMNQFIPPPPKPVHTIYPMNQFIPSIMNHQNESSIEPSEESSAVASLPSDDLTNSFPTKPNEANVSGSANAKLKSADGKEKAPHCAAPPRTTKTRAELIEKPSGVSEQVWNDFMTLRKAKRAPLSATALSAITKEAEKAAMHIEEALTECVTRGWQSFKAEWIKPKSAFTKPEKFSNF